LKVYFVTANHYKISELADYVERHEVQSRFGVEICPIKRVLRDLLLPDIEVIVRHKALEAYKEVRRPCVVEHGGLLLDAWRSSDGLTPGLLGGIGQVVWRTVGDRMCGFLRDGEPREATAVSVIGYCDGLRVRVHRGETRGKVTERALGEYEFNWDPIFIPDGFEQTYGQMGLEMKRSTSPVAKAWDEFLTAEFGARGKARHDAAPHARR
jgi:XTP/dITP diphosphohydrolase